MREIGYNLCYEIDEPGKSLKIRLLRDATDKFYTEVYSYGISFCYRND